MLLPVDMQSTSSFNQYFWKVVTNGPQGKESTLNTYKVSAGIVQVCVTSCPPPSPWLTKVQLQYNGYEMEIQPIHLAFIVSLELSEWVNTQNNFIYWYPWMLCSAYNQKDLVHEHNILDADCLTGPQIIASLCVTLS